MLLALVGAQFDGLGDSSLAVGDVQVEVHPVLRQDAAFHALEAEVGGGGDDDEVVRGVFDGASRSLA